MSGLSPVTITVLMPIARSSAKRGRMSGLTISLRWMTPSNWLLSETASGVPPAREMRSTAWLKSAGARFAGQAGLREHGVDRALAQHAPGQIDAGHAGLRGERHDDRLRGRGGRVEPVSGLGERDDRAALGGLVGEAGEQHRFGEARLADARHGDEFVRHAVAEGDRAGLVEQQRVDVARRLDGATRGRDHVEADQSIHAGDADGGEQAADRGRDQADEQRDQHRDRERRCRNRAPAARA